MKNEKSLPTFGIHNGNNSEFFFFKFSSRFLYIHYSRIYTYTTYNICICMRTYFYIGVNGLIYDSLNESVERKRGSTRQGSIYVYIHMHIYAFLTMQFALENIFRYALKCLSTDCVSLCVRDCDGVTPIQLIIQF